MFHLAVINWVNCKEQSAKVALFLVVRGKHASSNCSTDGVTLVDPDSNGHWLMLIHGWSKATEDSEYSAIVLACACSRLLVLFLLLWLWVVLVAHDKLATLIQIPQGIPQPRKVQPLR